MLSFITHQFRVQHKLGYSQCRVFSYYVILSDKELKQVFLFEESREGGVPYTPFLGTSETEDGNLQTEELESSSLISNFISIVGVHLA